MILLVMFATLCSTLGTPPPRLQAPLAGAALPPSPDFVDLELERRRAEAGTTGLDFVMPAHAKMYVDSRAADENPFREQLKADKAMAWFRPAQYRAFAHPAHGDPVVMLGLRTPAVTGNSWAATRSMLGTLTKLPYLATMKSTKE